MVAHRLKAIVSEPDLARLVRELWFGTPWGIPGEMEFSLISLALRKPKNS
jgi:hypothetical protein